MPTTEMIENMLRTRNDTGDFDPTTLQRMQTAYGFVCSNVLAMIGNVMGNAMSTRN